MDLVFCEQFETRMYNPTKKKNKFLYIFRINIAVTCQPFFFLFLLLVKKVSFDLTFLLFLKKINKYIYIYIYKHTARQFEQGTDASASQRDFRLRQKSQLRFARVRFKGIGALDNEGDGVDGLFVCVCKGLDADAVGE